MVNSTILRLLIYRGMQSVDGDVIDCVDISRQPAFDHPALANHTVEVCKHLLFCCHTTVIKISKNKKIRTYAAANVSLDRLAHSAIPFWPRRIHQKCSPSPQRDQKRHLHTVLQDSDLSYGIKVGCALKARSPFDAH